MIEKSGLRGLNVVRRHNQCRIRTKQLGLLRGGNGAGRTNRAGPNDDGQNSAYFFTSRSHHLRLLLDAHD